MESKFKSKTKVSNNQEIEDESEEQLITGPWDISSTAAITQCENIITYFKSNNIGVDLSPILKTLKEHAAIKQFNAKSQTSIKDFFSTSQTVTSEKKNTTVTRATESGLSSITISKIKKK